MTISETTIPGLPTIITGPSPLIIIPDDVGLNFAYEFYIWISIEGLPPPQKRPSNLKRLVVGCPYAMNALTSSLYFDVTISDPISASNSI